MVKEASLDKKLDAIHKLLNMFKFERSVYLIVTILSVMVLLFCAGFLIYSGTSNIPAIIGMFGSTGGIGYTCGRLLKMWSDAIRIIAPLKEEKNNE